MTRASRREYTAVQPDRYLRATRAEKRQLSWTREHRKHERPCDPGGQALVSPANPRLTPGTGQLEEREGERGQRDPARTPSYPAPPRGRGQGGGVISAMLDARRMKA